MATYRTCVADANTQKQELEDTKVNSLRQIHEVIKQSDQVIKTVSGACWGWPQGRERPCPDQEGFRAAPVPGELSGCRALLAPLCSEQPRLKAADQALLHAPNSSSNLELLASLLRRCQLTKLQGLIFSTLFSGHHLLLPDHAHADGSAARQLPDAV